MRIRTLTGGLAAALGNGTHLGYGDKLAHGYSGWE